MYVSVIMFSAYNTLQDIGSLLSSINLLISLLQYCHDLPLS